MGILDAPGLSRATTTGFTIAGLGNSITRSNSGAYNRGDSFLDYAVLLSSGRLVSVGNYGVAGERTDQMLARVNAALADKPAFLNVEGGTNDINQGVQAGNTTAQIVASASASLRAIYETARRKGTIPVANTVPPYGFSTGLSDPRKIANEALNNWIRRHAALNGYPLVDHYVNLVDPGTINGSTATAPGNWKYPALTYTTDGTHPTPYASGIMGQLLLDALLPYLPKNRFVQPMTTSVDSTQTMFTIKNVFFNTQTTNPGVFPNNANTTGAAISNSVGVTYSMIQEAGALGFALNVALSISSTGAGGIATQNSGETFTAGDIVQVCGIFSTDGGTSTLITVNAGGTTYKVVNIAAKTAINQGYYFMEFPMPATGTVSLTMQTGNAVAGTAANAKFWYPKLFNATKHLGVTVPLTRD